MENNKFQADSANQKHEEYRSFAVEMKKREVCELSESYRALMRGDKRTRMPHMSDVLWGDIEVCTNLTVTDNGLLTAQCVYCNGKYVTYRTWVPYDILKHYELV